MDQDLTQAIQAQVREAIEHQTPLAIRGGGTKDFYGPVCRAEALLDVTGHRGVVAYEPTELVITARAGTRLEEVERLLAEAGQELPFEPPGFGEGATIGGVVASGLSGPRRPYAGAVRDAVLGVKVINGKGQVLEFGGRVMKNVAGYDLSRLAAGSMGTLAVLLEVSIKVRPRSEGELTLSQPLDAPEALAHMIAWGRQPLPITATCHAGDTLYVRLCGGEQSLAGARKTLGGTPLADSPAFWLAVKEQRLPFFQDPRPLWRLSVPPATAPMQLSGDWFLEWGGAQRWLTSDAAPDAVRGAARSAGGHATLFRGGDRSGDMFSPLEPGLMRLHRLLKRSLDPHGLFNPGRLYREL